MGMIGIQELLVIAGIALLIFGPKQLPKLGRAAGEASKEFLSIKKSLDETKDEIESEVRKVREQVEL